MPTVLAGKVLHPQACPGGWAELAQWDSWLWLLLHQLTHPFIRMRALLCFLLHDSCCPHAALLVSPELCPDGSGVLLQVLDLYSCAASQLTASLVLLFFLGLWTCWGLWAVNLSPQGMFLESVL